MKKIDSAKVVDHKKDELIVTLESFSKLHDEEDVRTIFTETDSIKSSQILASYFEGGKYKTVAKLNFDSGDFEQRKESIDSNPQVKVVL